MRIVIRWWWWIADCFWDKCPEEKGYLEELLACDLFCAPMNSTVRRLICRRTYSVSKIPVLDGSKA